jgi:hypothetical protein
MGRLPHFQPFLRETSQNLGRLPHLYRPEQLDFPAKGATGGPIAGPPVAKMASFCYYSAIFWTTSSTLGVVSRLSDLYFKRNSLHGLIEIILLWKL